MEPKTKKLIRFVELASGFLTRYTDREAHEASCSALICRIAFARVRFGYSDLLARCYTPTSRSTSHSGAFLYFLLSLATGAFVPGSLHFFPFLPSS